MTEEERQIAFVEVITRLGQYCIDNKTDNCDVTIKIDEHKIKTHISFEAIN